MALQKTKKIIPIISEASASGYMSLYASQQKIYPRNTAGLYKNWRWAMIWLTQLIFYATPWLTWSGRQAVLFDISAHRFYIFGLVLYPQDLFYLAIILIISALALFLFTAVAGRLWCGFSCPQSVYTEIFLWMERKVEGDRTARQKLDASPLSAYKLYKKVCKHSAWIFFSMVTGFTFLGYFTPVRDLSSNILASQLSGWEGFWICFYGFATYGNAGFLREQVCKHMCPYARFQSAMFDKDTLIVTYDSIRGEPRSGRSRTVDAKVEGLGDCIDCQLCVQVCPVGIDIRDGLQYECISCGLCIDACNGIMDKMQYPRGLIRFSTQNALIHRWSDIALVRHVMRPRVLIYAALLMIFCVLFTYSMIHRPLLKVDIMRDRGVMSRLVEGQVQNIYQLRITNVSERRERYRFEVTGLAHITFSQLPQTILGATEEKLIPLTLQVMDGQVKSGVYPIAIKVVAEGTQDEVTEPSVFYMP